MAPTDFPDLERITVTTAFPIGDYEPGEIQQVKVVYEFNPELGADAAAARSTMRR